MRIFTMTYIINVLNTTNTTTKLALKCLQTDFSFQRYFHTILI